MGTSHWWWRHSGDAPSSPPPPPPPPPLPSPVRPQLRPAVPVRVAVPVDLHHVPDTPQGRPGQQAEVQGCLRGERGEADRGAEQRTPTQEEEEGELAWSSTRPESIQEGNSVIILSIIPGCNNAQKWVLIKLFSGCELRISCQSGTNETTVKILEN